MTLTSRSRARPSGVGSKSSGFHRRRGLHRSCRGRGRWRHSRPGAGRFRRSGRRHRLSMSLLAAGEERTTLNQARSATLQAGVSIRFGPKSTSDLPGAQFVPNTPHTAVTHGQPWSTISSAYKENRLARDTLVSSSKLAIPPAPRPITSLSSGLIRRRTEASIPSCQRSLARSSDCLERPRTRHCRLGKRTDRQEHSDRSST
jgi:hypothetical protein